MKIVSCASISENLLKEITVTFPDFIYEKNILELDRNVLNEVEVLVGYPFNITEKVLENLPKLKMIHIMQSGVEGLPYHILIEKNIIVTSSRNINSVTISEYLFEKILGITRNSLEFHYSQKNKEWNTDTNIDEIYEKTIGILGYGAVGKQLAQRAKAFGMKVIATKRQYTQKLDNVDEFIKPENIDEMVEKSDFLVSLLPSTPQTKGLIGKEQIDLMKESSVFLNVSRSDVVDVNYLLKILEDQKIKAVVLDVFETEPLPTDSKLWNVNNLYITPHIAGDRFPKYKQRAFSILLENLKKYQSNDIENMKNVVNKEQGY